MTGYCTTCSEFDTDDARDALNNLIRDARRITRKVK